MSRHQTFIAGVVLLIVVALGAHIVGVSTGPDLKRAIAEDQAYCNQTFGSPDLYNAQVIGRHGGLHCVANDGDHPHLHFVPESNKELAYMVEHDNASVNWTKADQRVIDQWENRPWYETGSWPILLPALGVLGFTVLLGFALKYLPGDA